MSQIYGYARISSRDQNEARQLAALREAGVPDRDIYLDRTGVQQLTCDDVTEDGKLTEYLGRAGALQVQYLEGEAAQRGFLLCTDGFYRRMPQELLPKAAGARRRAELDRLLAEMSQSVKQRGERDNISAVIIKTKG